MWHEIDWRYPRGAASVPYVAHHEPLDLAMQQAVRAALAEAGMTLSDCANAINLAENSFSRRMNGHIAFQWNEIVAIARATHRSVADLVHAAERIAGFYDDRASA